MVKILLKVLRGTILKRIVSESFKSELIARINKEVDIPKLDEAEEEKLFKAVVDAVLAIIL